MLVDAKKRIFLNDGLARALHDASALIRNSIRFDVLTCLVLGLTGEWFKVNAFRFGFLRSWFKELEFQGGSRSSGNVLEGTHCRQAWTCHCRPRARPAIPTWYSIYLQTFEEF